MRAVIFAVAIFTASPAFAGYWFTSPETGQKVYIPFHNEKVKNPDGSFTQNGVRTMPLMTKPTPEQEAELRSAVVQYRAFELWREHKGPKPQ